MRATPIRLRPRAVLCQCLLAWVLATAADAQQPPGFFKVFSPATIGPGSVSTLTFHIDNSEDPGLLSDLAFTDTLPAGVTVATPGNAVTTCTDGAVSAPDGGTTISLSGGRLEAFTACTVTVDVTSSTPGTHTNVSGDLTSNAGSSGPATDALTVATSRPGFTKSFAPDPIVVGGTSTLTLTIDNTANGAVAGNLSFSDALPAGLVIAAPANASTTCTGGLLTATPGAAVISYAGGSVGAQAACAVSVDVAAGIAGLLGNTTGELTSGGVSSGKASATLDVKQDFLTKVFTDDPAAPGDPATLVFTVVNFDRASPVTGITFTDDLNAALAGLSAVGLPLADPCGPGSQLTGTSLLTLTGGSLPPEGSCAFSVTLQVPGGAAPGVYPNTTSPVTADLGGAGFEAPPASDSLVVAPLPRLTKTFTDDPVVAGGTATLEFTLANTSTTDGATDIAFSDDLDALIAGLVPTLPAGGFCGPASSITVGPPGARILVVTGASLAPGASCTFAVSLLVPAAAPGGTYVNTTSAVTATVGNAPLAGKPAADALAVVTAPLLTKAFVGDPVLPGGTVTLQFTLAYDENAPAGASGIAFTDDLGAALPGLVATGLPASGVCGAGSQLGGTSVLTLTGGTLGPNTACTFSVTLQVPGAALPGSYVNTTSAVTATSLGLAVTRPPATDGLQVGGLALTKTFTGDPVLPGGTLTLEFTLASAIGSAVTGIAFTDDLGAALPGLAATGLPAPACGGTLSGPSVLTLTGGSLGPGGSCTFSVTLQVPGGAAPGEYTNTTSAVTADVGGSPVTVGPAADAFVVSPVLSIVKAFTDDPAAPGGTATLRFTLANLDPAQPATGLAFTDDLGAALPGLAAVGLPAADVCGAGSQLSGTGVLAFTGGSLGPGASCAFAVTLQVPAGAPFGTLAVNTTGPLTGTVGGVEATGGPGTDTLQIGALTFTKAFGGPAVTGGRVVLTFTIANPGAGSDATGLSFLDDLGAVLPGLAAVGLPASDVCGAGSSLAGTTLLTLSNGALDPGGSCTFGVTLQVPPTAAPGSYPNTTSALLVSGLPGSGPATATLVVTAAPAPGFAKAFAPGSIAAGGVAALTFTIDHSASPVAATALDFTDTLPAGVVVATPPGASTTCAGGVLTAGAGSATVAYTGGTVAAGATCTVQVRVTSATPGTHVNTSGPLTSSLGTSPAATATLVVTGPTAGGGGVLVTGPDAGGGADVRLFDATPALQLALLAYAPGFTGGVRVAAGDVGGDGRPDIVTGAGPGGGPHVRVFDGVTGAEILGFLAYAPGFLGGIFVAAGDVTGDGRADVVTGGETGQPQVRLFDGLGGAEIRSFLAYDPGFTGAVRVAAGDVDGDGRADIVTGAGPGGGPHVRVFDGVTGAEILGFFAYAPGFLGGVRVAAGDVDGDGRADVVTGAGPGGGPHVRVFDGVTGAEVRSFFAYDPGFLGGVFVGAP